MKKILYTILTVIIIVAVIAFVFGDTKKLTGDTKATKDLTLGTAVDWRNATQDEKIAACVKFVTNLKNSEPENTFTTEQMRVATRYLYECTDVAVGKDGNDEMKVVELAAACLVQFKK
jgi:cell shape-determining protein MreC